MSYASKEEALEVIVNMALNKELPSLQQVAEFKEAGVNYASAYKVLKEIFYDDDELPDA